MSDDPAPLQFDKAEFPGAPAQAATCARCQQPLVDSYWDVGGKAVCPSCSEALSAEWNGRTGSRLRAVWRGGLAAVVGAALWITITMLTGYEIGLVAIVVGVIVGTAVKKASAEKGGRSYQLIAVGLTYFAITSSYVPHVWKGIQQGAAKHDKAETAAPPAGEVAAPAPDAPAAEEPPAAEVSPQAAAPAAQTPTINPWLAVALLAVVIFGIALAGPFLGGFDNIIGIAIVGFALWEAWRVNRAVELKVNGPFKVADLGAAPAPPP